MQKLIINVKTGQQQVIEMTAKEVADRQVEIDKALQKKQVELDKENQKAAALQRLQTAALSDANLADLLTYLSIS
jgi:hypothetical protein